MKLSWLVTLGVVLLLGNMGLCQQSFLKENRVWLPSYLALQGADAWGTERDQSYRYHHERNPLIPGTTLGRAGYFAGTAAGVISIAWLFHHYQHHRWEKATLWIASGIELQAGIRSWTKK
jgi:hypothetical protein